MTIKHTDETTAMRLDKWLWCARLYKTRALAAAAVRKGKVQVNNIQVKPSHVVRPGDEVHIKSGTCLQRIAVLALVKNRCGIQAATQLYREDPASIEQRRLIAELLQANLTIYPDNHGKPTKRERRKLSEFKKGFPGANR